MCQCFHRLRPLLLHAGLPRVTAGVVWVVLSLYPCETLVLEVEEVRGQVPLAAVKVVMLAGVHTEVNSVVEVEVVERWAEIAPGYCQIWVTSKIPPFLGWCDLQRLSYSAD